MSSNAVTIRPVVTRKDRKAFVDFAWEVYQDDPAWVPPLMAGTIKICGDIISPIDEEWTADAENI